MGLLSWMRGGSKSKAVVAEEVKKDPVTISQDGVVDGVVTEPKPQPKPVPPRPKKTEAQVIIEEEEVRISKANVAIDKAQEELYDKRATLNVKHAALKKLAGEIEGHKTRIDDLRQRSVTASETDKRDIINEGQKVQTLLLRKEQEYNSQAEAILTFEKAIDMLEQTISQNVISNNRRQSDLTSAKTLVSVQELSTTVSSHLALTSFNEEDNKLQVLVEKTKLQMDDVNAEMSSVVVDAPMLTFREQVNSIEEAEVVSHAE